MTSATTRKSLAERPPRQHIGSLVSQRLLVRCPAAQGVEPDAPRLEVHLPPDQAMLPEPVHGEGPAQQLHLPLGVAAPQEDQPPVRVRLQVQTQLRREGEATESRLLPWRPTAATRGRA